MYDKINKIKTAWLSWNQLLPFKEQLIEMERDLIIRYHYPDRNVSQEYLEQRFINLERFMNDGSTYFWAAIEEGKLIGYYWAYITQFLDTKRWNLRSLYISEKARGKGIGKLALQEGLLKAKELGCDEAATEYVPWNKVMEKSLKEIGYQPARIEVVKKI